MIVSNSVLLLKSPTEDEDKYEKILVSNGFKVKLVTTLAFHFKKINELRSQLEKHEEFSGLLFSSPRCVTAVQMGFECVPNKDHCLEEWRKKDNFVVGEATCKKVQESMHIQCYGKETGNAANLSRFILERQPVYKKPFLFPHGNLKTDTLTLELNKGDIDVTGVEVYDTIANPDIEKDFAIATDDFQSVPEFVVFFSPSGFSNTVGLIEKILVDINQLKFVAIGPVTEAAITEKGLKVYSVAKRPNPEELLEAILFK